MAFFSFVKFGDLSVLTGVGTVTKKMLNFFNSLSLDVNLTFEFIKIFLAIWLLISLFFFNSLILLMLSSKPKTLKYLANSTANGNPT